MTARLVDLLQLVNTWAQAQTFSGEVTCNGLLTSGAGTVTRGGSYFQNAKTQGLYLQNNNATPLSRFMVQLSPDAAEDFYLNRFDNAGNYLSTPVIGYRSSGIFDFQLGLRSGGQDVWRNGLATLLNANPGAVVFPNGFKIQCGSNALGANAAMAVTLPYAYSTVHLGCVGSLSGVAAGWASDTNNDGTAYPLNLSQVQVVNGDPGNAATVRWLSCGW